MIRWWGGYRKRRRHSPEQFGYAHHTTNLAEALAARQPEVVCIASPSEAHAGQVAQALRAGAHVLVEIPLAMSYTEGHTLAGLAREKGRVLMVAHTHRYRSAAQEAKRKSDERCADLAPYRQPLRFSAAGEPGLDRARALMDG